MTTHTQANQEETFRPTFPTLSNPPYPRLSYGIPFYESCTKHIKDTFHSKRPYIIASNTLSKKTPFLTQLQNALNNDPEITLSGTWIGIPPHSPLNSLLPIAEDMRKKQADALITLGGGSLSDGAKFISLLLANTEISTREQALKLPHARLSDIDNAAKNPDAEAERYANINAPTVPVICVPISLSGGEYSKFAGITDDETHAKIQFTHPRMFPSLVVVDPVISLSTPLHTWLSTGVRSIDHCVEGFLSRYAKPETDKAALEAVALLVNGILHTYHDPQDQDARLSSALGSNLSMSLLYAGVMKGASHGIGHQLGPMGVGHGETSCILLPKVCKWNAVVNGEKQEVLKGKLGELDSVKNVLVKAGVDATKADLGDVLRAVFDALEMPRTLKDVGITGQDQLDRLAQNCLDEVYVESNPREMKTKEEILAFLDTVAER